MKKLILAALSLFLVGVVFSQNVGIGTNTPNASAALDISDSTRGILIPRVTLNKRNAIQNPAEGLLVYQTDDSTGFWFYTGQNWMYINSKGIKGDQGLKGDSGISVRNAFVNGDSLFVELSTGSILNAGHVRGATGFLQSGSTAGNTPYWDGTSWVTSSSNIYNNGGSVGIKTTAPSASAALEIKDTTRGILIPRMTMAQRNAIQNPAEGLMVYQTDSTKGYWYWDGSLWLSQTRDNSSIKEARNVKVFNSVGDYTWTVPDGVNKITVELWAGAGGGGGQGGKWTGSNVPSNFGSNGGNGGSGGYNKVIINVNSGNVFQLKVGKGGKAGQNGAISDVSNFSPVASGPAARGQNGESGISSQFGDITVQAGTGGEGGYGSTIRWDGNFYRIQQPTGIANNGSDGLVNNYQYNSGINTNTPIRTYIPINYIPSYPLSKSIGGGGSTTLPTNTALPGEDGLILIYY
jgi:hypothetical protein